MPTARIIADSISPEGVRLVTMEVRMHRFVLAEFNTHRVFSRNSASSRAIPVSKQIDRIHEDLAYPLEWPAEQKGMQGGEPLSDKAAYEAETVWLGASQDARNHAMRMQRLGPNADEPLHKSVINRVLEPYMHHTVVVTSTAWENFFALRTDKDAQPEIRLAATTMQAAYRDHKPKPLQGGEWHLPYVESEDYKAASGMVGLGESMYPLLAKVSSARCARTSYLTQDGKRDLTEDLGLYDRLVTERVEAGKPVHWSPLEHVATPWPGNRQAQYPRMAFQTLDGGLTGVETQHLPRVGNLLGWRSLRTEVEAINKERTYR